MVDRAKLLRLCARFLTFSALLSAGEIAVVASAGVLAGPSAAMLALLVFGLCANLAILAAAVVAGVRLIRRFAVRRAAALGKNTNTGSQCVATQERRADCRLIDPDQMDLPGVLA